MEKMYAQRLDWKSNTLNACNSICSFLGFLEMASLMKAWCLVSKQCYNVVLGWFCLAQGGHQRM